MGEFSSQGSENEQINEGAIKEYGVSCENTEKYKKKKPGILYFSTIPQKMTAALLRERMSEFGEVGRTFLQEVKKDEDKRKKRKKTYARKYSEGWVEFKSKRVAKDVAQMLNNTKVGGKKKSIFYDSLWTIKYLPRFKWIHLSGRLAYERAVHKQRMRTEIHQAKREADYFSLNVETSEQIKKKKSKGQELKPFIPTVQIKQRETEDQIMEKKQSKNRKFENKKDGINDRDSFLKSLFA